MDFSLILAHPRPGSFNHAIAATAREAMISAGHTVHFHDLYAERFDPLLTPAELGQEPSSDPLVLEHCRQIKQADGVVIVHPNWWAQPPAILKGWVDRVLRQGVAYKFGTNDKGEGVPIGLLRAKVAMIFNTSNTPQDREVALFGDPLENLWKTCIFNFCGIQKVVRKQYNVVVISTLEQRQGWLADVKRMVGGDSR